MQFIAPLSQPSDSIENLDGSSGIIDNKENIESTGFPWNIVYTIGDRMCHQKSERSFFINQNQMPFCSRCTAIWTGFTFGLLLFLLISIEVDDKFFILMLLGVIPIGIDGVGQMLGFWESTNLIRVLTGLLIGIICGISIGIIIEESKSFFRKKEKRN